MKTIIDFIRENANKRPDHPAIVTEEGTDYRYEELWEAVRERSAQFKQSGIGRGDRCGLFCQQGPAFVISALGILDVGGCFVPIPVDERGNKDSQYLKKLQPHYLIDEAEDYVPEERPGVAPIDRADDQEFNKLNPAYIRLTSGTTSDSQGVLLGHRTILERTKAANKGLSITPDDRILWVLPMVHHFVVSILLYLRYGATILLPAHDLAGPQLEFAEEQNCSVLYATPFQHNLLARGPEEFDLPDLRLAISTASGLREEIAERFSARFPVPLTQALGIMEVGLPIINLNYPGIKPLSIGRPLPDYEVKLLDSEHEPIGASTDHRKVGEIAVDGPGLLDAYVSPWEPRESVVGDYGFETEDQGRFDGDGDLFLVGRRANRINMAGTKFFCEEVERVLNTHGDVKVSRVKGVPHDHLGEIPVADVVLNGKAGDAESLQSYCRDRLENHMVPRTIEFVKSIPRTPTGKIKRS